VQTVFRVYVGYLERTLRISEEVVKRGTPLADCMGEKPPRPGVSEYDADPCCILSTLDCDPHHLTKSTVLPYVL
jgi:hypothetical protein